MTKPTLTIGLIGYQFMGKAHSNAYRQAEKFFDLPVHIRMKTLCGRNEVAVKHAAVQLGWESYATDWRAVLEDPEIDVVDVSTPGDSHAEISIAAAKAGKAVLCEKPLGNTLEEAEMMLDAVRKAKVPHGLFHNYRKAPAVTLARQLIDEGRLGTLYHFRGTYLQDWIVDPEFPLVWRLKKELAGSGVHGDLNAHIIDLARYLVGEIGEVCGQMKTFISERPLVDDPTKRGQVTVDDAAMFLARFENGAIGTFEASRFAPGRKNYNRFEINGSKGSLVFNLERMNELEFFDSSDAAHTQGFRVIQASDGCHPYAGRYWPVGHILGYEHTFVNLVADAMTAIHEKKELSPNFEDGLKNQRVLDAVERSCVSRAWVGT